MSQWTTKSRPGVRDYIVIKHFLRNVNYKINGVTFRDGYGVVERNSKAHRALRLIPFFKNGKELPLTELRNLKFITKTSDVRSVYGMDVYTHFLAAETALKEKQTKDAEEAAIQQAAQEQAEREAEIKKLNEVQEAKEQIKESLNVDEFVEEFMDENEDLMDDLAKLEEQEKQLLSGIQKCTHRTRTGDLCKHDAFYASPSLYCRLHLLEDPKLADLQIEIPSEMSKEDKKKLRKKVVKQLMKLHK